MFRANCTKCQRPVPLMSRDSSGLCLECLAQEMRKNQAETIDNLRRIEDGFFGLILSVLPTRSRPTLARLLSTARVRGLAKLVGGLALAVPIFLFFNWIGRVTNV